MKDLEKLKRQMLRAAVRENVELADDRRYLKRRFGGRRLKLVARVLLAVLVPAVLFVSINAISTGGGTPEVLVVRPGEPAPASGDAAPRAPRVIDPTLFRLHVVRVVLDPGHGGNDPGASAPSGLTEKDVTLDVARRLQALLRDDGYKVSLTRESDRRMTLRDRTRAANEAHADLFLSIHVNSIPMPDQRGVETYFLGAAEEPMVERLAGAENAESGYSLSDFRKLLEGVFSDVRQHESRRFAGAVQRGLYEMLRPSDPRLKDRGVKSAPLAVLVGTEMPGVLAEVACLSNEEDAALLSREGHRQAIAEALRRGIQGYSDRPAREPETRAKKGSRAG